LFVMGQGHETPLGQRFGHCKFDGNRAIVVGQQLGKEEGGFVEVDPRRNRIHGERFRGTWISTVPSGVGLVEREEFGFGGPGIAT